MGNWMCKMDGQTYEVLKEWCDSAREVRFAFIECSRQFDEIEGIEESTYLSGKKAF